MKYVNTELKIVFGHFHVPRSNSLTFAVDYHAKSDHSSTALLLDRMRYGYIEFITFTSNALLLAQMRYC